MNESDSEPLHRSVSFCFFKKRVVLVTQVHGSTHTRQLGIRAGFVLAPTTTPPTLIPLIKRIQLWREEMKFGRVDTPTFTRTRGPGPPDGLNIDP